MFWHKSLSGSKGPHKLPWRGGDQKSVGTSLVFTQHLTFNQAHPATPTPRRPIRKSALPTHTNLSSGKTSKCAPQGIGTVFNETVDIQYKAGFRCPMLWLDTLIHHEVITVLSLGTTCPHSYCSVTDHIPYVMSHCQGIWIVSQMTQRLTSHPIPKSDKVIPEAVPYKGSFTDPQGCPLSLFFLLFLVVLDLCCCVRAFLQLRKERTTLCCCVGSHCSSFSLQNSGCRHMGFSNCSVGAQ